MCSKRLMIWAWSLIPALLAWPALCAVGPDLFGYTAVDSLEPEGPAFQWIDITVTGTPLFLGDDDHTGALPVGFDFPFYWETQDSFHIVSNGFLMFHEQSSHFLKHDCPLPSDKTGNDFIALLSADLDPDENAAYFQTYPPGSCPYGDYGGACLVVLYEEYAHFGGAGDAGTFEALLFGDGDILIQFLDAGDFPGDMSTTGIGNLDRSSALAYSCDTPESLDDGLAILFRRPDAGLYAETANPARRCFSYGGIDHQLHLHNFTDVPQTFTLLYSGFTWPLTGPGVVGPVAPGSHQAFTVRHDFPPGPEVGDWDDGSVFAMADGVEATLTLSAEVVLAHAQEEPSSSHDHAQQAVLSHGGRIWALGGFESGVVESFHPASSSWSPGTDHESIFYNPSDAAVGNDATGASVAVIFPDGTGSPDWNLQVYDLDANLWRTEDPPDDFPEDGIWAHDVSCIPQENLCIITGGNSSPWSNAGDSDEAYSYDPATGAFSELPSFDTARAWHASFLYEGMLCIAGGADEEWNPLDSTQCLDLATEVWHTENADLGPLPFPWWGMADGSFEGISPSMPILAGGVDAEGYPVDVVYGFDGSSWVLMDHLPTAVWACEGAVIGDTLYVSGGSDKPDVFPTNLLQSITLCAAQEADLSLAKEAEPADPPVGGVITYTLEVTNLGPSSSSATITDPLPDAAAFVSCECDPGAACVYEAGSHTVTVTTDPIAPGESLEAMITCEVLDNGSLDNTAIVAGEKFDPDPSNDAATAEALPEGYLLTLVDDQGRSWVCIDTRTGEWSWTDASTGVPFTFGGFGLVHRNGGILSVVAQPGEPWSLTVRFYENYGFAYGNFIFRAYRIRSSLHDRDSRNNPPLCQERSRAITRGF